MTLEEVYCLQTHTHIQVQIHTYHIHPHSNGAVCNADSTHTQTHITSHTHTHTYTHAHSLSRSLALYLFNCLSFCSLSRSPADFFARVLPRLGCISLARSLSLHLSLTIFIPSLSPPHTFQISPVSADDNSPRESAFVCVEVRTCVCFLNTR